MKNSDGDNIQSCGTSVCIDATYDQMLFPCQIELSRVKIGVEAVNSAVCKTKDVIIKAVQREERTEVHIKFLKDHI
jgi:hypothetical protein